MSKFNEDSRVKIPAILHLCRLGYKYISLNNAVWDSQTNIFTDVFKESITKINLDFDQEQAERLLVDTLLLLDNEDLGQSFFEKLISGSGIKLIDFDNFEKLFSEAKINSFRWHVRERPLRCALEVAIFPFWRVGQLFMKISTKIIPKWTKTLYHRVSNKCLGTEFDV